jgi:GNAT superfamily N-acetyltransferase
MKQGLQIRRMQPRDLARVHALLQPGGYDVDAASLERTFARVSALHEHELLVADRGAGDVLGWVHVFGTHVLFDPPFAEIAAIVVDDAHRGAGAGTALLRAAEDWARASGYATIRVRARLSRERVHRFWIAAGYAKEKAQYTFVRQLPADPSAR